MKRRTYIILIVVIFALLVLVQLFQKQETDWSPSYSRYHKKPFGSFVLYELLQNLFPASTITTTRETVRETLEAHNYDAEEKACYLFTSGNFNFHETELDELIGFADTGNYVFLSAYDLPQKLLDTLGMTTGMFPFEWLRDTTAKILLNDESLSERTYYHFKKGAGYFYFNKYPCDARVLSTNEEGFPVTLSVPFGEGTFILNTTPVVFTNYYMLNDTTSRYIAKTLSYLPEDAGTVYWDEFYRVGRAEATTILRFILVTPPLKWAYYLLVTALLLYLLSEVKRRQRAIPVIARPVNATVEFVTTVGRLYFQQGNHKDLAKKKVSYFLEDLRRKYFLRNIDLTEASAERVAMRSGVPVEEVRALFHFIVNMEQEEVSNEVQLLTLNNIIENFYRKAK